MRSLPGIDLDQYRTQAKDLLKQVRAEDPESLRRFKQHHPEHLSPGRVRLADTQLVLAREFGFPSWAKFKEYVLFRQAVRALDSGDVPGLESLLTRYPFLLRYRCHVGEPYEEGYFAGATLLNHIAGNPGRCPLPPNIVEIARLLIARGAREQPSRPKYTIGLLLTSKQASEAGAAMPLIDMLTASRGIALDLNDPEAVSGPLLNEARATAEALVKRGARMDLRHASGLGRLDLVKRLVEGGEKEEALIPLPEDAAERKALMEEAFIRSCMLDQPDVAEYLLDQGVDPAAQANIGQTGLHYAAHMGQIETVRRLLERKAPLEVKNMYGATVLGQALWSAVHEPREEHPAIIRSLVAAGAKVDPSWATGIEGVDVLLRAPGSV